MTNRLTEPIKTDKTTSLYIAYIKWTNSPLSEKNEERLASKKEKNSFQDALDGNSVLSQQFIMDFSSTTHNF